MDATSSLNKPSWFKQLQLRYRQVTFVPGDSFRWAAAERTLYFDPRALQTEEGSYDLLHELGHALLGHASYTYDVTLVQMEAEAWQQASLLAEESGMQLSEPYAQASLETYRDWLAKRSTCPTCASTGIQKNKRTYQCINCRCAWRVNDAKFCALRRTTAYAARSN